MAAYVTMRDRVISLGFPYPGNHLAWALGNLIRDRWADSSLSNGSLPLKDLRVKTNSRGSHCFAIYPMAFAPEMDEIIGNVLDSKQGWLPFYPDNLLLLKGPMPNLPTPPPQPVRRIIIVSQMEKDGDKGKLEAKIYANESSAKGAFTRMKNKTGKDGSRMLAFWGFLDETTKDMTQVLASGGDFVEEAAAAS